MSSARAARLVEHGNLRVEGVRLPEPADDEVLVELAYAGVNPVDRFGVEGPVAADGPLPRTIGGEASRHLDGRPVVIIATSQEMRAAMPRAIAEFAAGRLRIRIGHCPPLARVADAFAALADRAVIGKVVLDLHRSGTPD